MDTREALQLLRRSLGNWSQHRLAHELGVRSGTISRWEREVTRVPVWWLAKLRSLAKHGADQRPLGFIDEQINAIWEKAEHKALGVSLREVRDSWMTVAEHNRQLTDALTAVEWLPMLPDSDTLMCPLCDQVQENGHAPDCLIGMALSNEIPPEANGGG